MMSKHGILIVFTGVRHFKPKRLVSLRLLFPSNFLNTSAAQQELVSEGFAK